MALPNILKDKLRLPVVGAPLFIISHPALVIAQCKAGIVGAFPALNARPISQLDEWLHEITEALAAHDRAHPERPAAPFAVNQIVHKSNARLEEDMALTVKWKAPIVITSLGAREDVNAAVHGYGGADAARHHQQPLRPQGDREGRRRLDRGRGRRRRPRRVDLAVRADSGHPRMVRRAARCSRARSPPGRAVLAAQVMGADLAYIGSAFVATPEARAIEDYKQAIVAGDASDIIGSTYFTGIFGNYLRPSIVRSGLDPESLPRARREGDELRLPQQLFVGGQGLARHLGQRPGHRRGQVGAAGGRARRAARARICRGEEAHVRAETRVRTGACASSRSHP